jgi:hypothetical protein
VETASIEKERVAAISADLAVDSGFNTGILLRPEDDVLPDTDLLFFVFTAYLRPP